MTRGGHMLRGLITGTLHNIPSIRTSAGGNSFAMAKLKDNSETPPAWYSVVTFRELSEALAKMTIVDAEALYRGKDGTAPD